MEVDNKQLRAIIEADPPKAHEKLLKNSTLTILPKTIRRHRAKLERWRSVSGCLTGWLQVKKKIIVLKCCLLFYSMCDEKWILSTTSNGQLSGWTEKHKSTSQANSHLKKGHGHCLVVCCRLIHHSFPESQLKLLHLRSMLSKSRCTKKLHCLQLALVNRKNPLFLHDNVQLHMAQPILPKVERVGLWEFLPHSPDLLPADYHLFKHLDNFLQESTAHNQQQEAENAFKGSSGANTDFYAKRINKFISHWKKCWL